MWMTWEKQLTPEAARDDAKKLFYSLSELLHVVVFYHLIYPSLVMEFTRPEDIREIEFPDNFLQHMLNRLGFDQFNFLELIIATVKNTYAYITSDLGAYQLSSTDREVLKSWSYALNRLYPAFSGYTSTKKSPHRMEISVYTDDTLAAAVSPRFVAALRMLQLRTSIISNILEPTVLGPSGEPVEYKPKPLEELPQDTAEYLRDHTSVSAPDLAFLAGVSHPYVTKLFRAGRLPARKKGKFILIPAKTAVAFVISRPAYPKWVKTLADRTKIFPLDT